ncbi:transposase [Kitasatospora sp. NPDC052896]|uniref:transposase n=1 Tax=Kitasatospora sp. NPDC052896 TaxID=3364061 RepID=UPI0037CBAA6C
MVAGVVRVSMWAAGLPEVPEQTALVAAAAFPKGALAMWVREKLAEVFTDEPFASALGVRGAPGRSPGMLALVTVLRFAENLTDHQAAEMVVRAIDRKYALGLELADPGFDFTVLAKFRVRLVEHGMERMLFDRLVEHCRGEGLIAAGGKQRTDSTHVISAVRDLNRLELAGESVRAALEALAVAAPTWLGQAMPVVELELRHAARIDSWRLPTSKTKRDRLAEVYGQDALALLHRVRPNRLRHLPVPRQVHHHGTRQPHAHPAVPRPAREHRRGPRRAEHRHLTSQVRPPCRGRGHHQPDP